MDGIFLRTLGFAAAMGSASPHTRQHSGARISTLDANGERAYLDDSQRAAQLDRARAAAAQWCQ